MRFGLTTRRNFDGRVRERVDDHPTLEMIAEALLSARKELDRQFAHFEA